MKMPPLAPTSLALRRQQAMLKAIGWLMSATGSLLIVAVPVLVFLFARLVNRPTGPSNLRLDFSRRSSDAGQTDVLFLSEMSGPHR